MRQPFLFPLVFGVRLTLLRHLALVFRSDRPLSAFKFGLSLGFFLTPKRKLTLQF